MGITETETVVKRILPYLQRRGYSVNDDMSFEALTKDPGRYTKGYVDILITKHGTSKPLFLVEAKRQTKALTAKDREQALSYGRGLKVPFVVVTNGIDLQLFNSSTGNAIRWNGKLDAHVPTKAQLGKLMTQLKANPKLEDFTLDAPTRLPFRPGLPLKQLNKLFAQCHKIIRNIEKDEDSAFADFSKLLFLKLLEEKADVEQDFPLPYSYTFSELSSYPPNQADQVRTAVTSMLTQVKAQHFGDVLTDDLHLKQPKTYRELVRLLAGVSFADSGLDTKGAAFEYFVRATLKGKKLGQYFTPRPLVELMSRLVGETRIIESLSIGAPVTVLDPACGTGGFLVFGMKQALSHVEGLVAKKKLVHAAAETLRERVRSEVFFGADANAGVASAAKMNMIVAGDGHTNIRCEDALKRSSKSWAFNEATYDIILSNPPFGTSEADSLTPEDLAEYPIRTSRGQYLFIERMILATKPGGIICTVIDEGLLNTATGVALRRWVLSKCSLSAVVELPTVTFQPNKINVRASVLLLERRLIDDDLHEADEPVRFCRLRTLGYDGTGSALRKFDAQAFFDSVSANIAATTPLSDERGTYFTVRSTDIVSDRTSRFDAKYWDPAAMSALAELVKIGTAVADLTLIPTDRGKSPKADLYVDEADGYALVVKAGSNVTRRGTILVDNADWIEKDVYDSLPDSAKLHPGDVLVSSTGAGTLGKVAVFNLDVPAIADGHISVIRPDTSKIDPWYLCDYLRYGPGQRQIQRLFTGSTGLIELTSEDLDSIPVDLRAGSIAQQRALSDALRNAESYRDTSVMLADVALGKAIESFGGTANLLPTEDADLDVEEE